MNFEREVESRFKCPKCGRNVCRVEKIAVTGAGITRLLDLQTNVFYAVICENCGYTEFYSKNVIDGKGDGIMDVLDVIFG